MDLVPNLGPDAMLTQGCDILNIGLLGPGTWTNMAVHFLFVVNDMNIEHMFPL